MATFPTIRSGVCRITYGSSLSIICKTTVIRFCDDSEQRFVSANPIRSFTAVYTDINYADLQTLSTFFAQMRGRQGRFNFPDPRNGATIYADMVFQHDDFSAVNTKAQRWSVTLKFAQVSPKAVPVPSVVDWGVADFGA